MVRVAFKYHGRTGTNHLNSISLLLESSFRFLSQEHKYSGRLCWRLDSRPPKVCLRVEPNGWLLTASSFHTDAKHRPQGAIEVAGVGNATTGSVTDQLTRELRMTLDEAHSILNAKRGDNLENILRVRPGCSRVE